MKKAIDVIFLVTGALLTFCSALASFLSNIDWLQVLSWSLLALQLVVWAFLSFGWTLCTKIKWVRSLFPPNINGEYEGTLRSDYGGGLVKEFAATIEQNLYGLTVKIVTNQIVSASSTATFRKEGGVWKLLYVYSTISRDGNDKRTNPESLGGASLVMCDDGFEGNYWTSNKTTGSLKLTKKTHSVNR